MKLTTTLVYKFNRILNKLYKLRILDTLSSIQYLINNKVSLARFGDGEMNIILGGDIHFQIYDDLLSRRLKEILTSPSKPGLMIGIPLPINNVQGYKKESAEFWKMNMDTGRMHWFKFCSFNRHYLNTNLTRCFYDYENRADSKMWFGELIKIWDNKKILIVEGKTSQLGVNNSLFSNSLSIHRIIAPAENAWGIYEELLYRVKEVGVNYDLILVSLGPTATVLTYDMLGFCEQIIDIGHLNSEYKSYLSNNGVEFNSSIITTADYSNQIIYQFI